MPMTYSYYQDPEGPSKFSVADNVFNEWRGVITRTHDDKWRSQNGQIFTTQPEAADHNVLGSPPSRPTFKNMPRNMPCY
jgi:hypothetical protein